MTVVVEPMELDGTIRMHPIGYARSIVERQRNGGFQELRSRIELRPELADYLLGLEQYSHLLVLFWMHEQLTPKAITRPQGNPAAPEIGMLACR